MAGARRLRIGKGDGSGSEKVRCGPCLVLTDGVLLHRGGQSHGGKAAQSDKQLHLVSVSVGVTLLCRAAVFIPICNNPSSHIGNLIIRYKEMLV